MTALRWRDISLRKGERMVLDSVSLSVAHGELLGIIGRNGAGKTALLRCALGLEGRGHAHRVEVGGVLAARLSPIQRARALAYLPQQAEAAWPITRPPPPSPSDACPTAVAETRTTSAR